MPLIRRKGEKLEIPAKYLLSILSLLCIALMILSFNLDLEGGFVKDALSYIVVPFQKGVSSAGYYLSLRSEELTQIRDLLVENERLKNQVATLTEENTLLQQDRYELASLRELYALDSDYGSFEKTGARIIAKDPGNWFASFIIDKGAADGIRTDMNVIAGGGLVGRIEEVGPNWSRVISIISDNSNVSGMVLSTQDHLIVSGNLETYARGLVDFSQLVDADDMAAEGDKVVTSNISDKFLPGILIGYFYSINPDSNNLTKSGYVTPAVDFEHLQEVLVILGTKAVPEN